MFCVTRSTCREARAALRERWLAKIVIEGVAKTVVPMVLPALLVMVPAGANAQGYQPDFTHGIVSRDSASAHGLTLVMLTKDSTFDPAIRDAMAKTFFTVYPRERKTFNAAAPKRVVYLFDPSYSGVAATWADSGVGYTVVGTRYMRSHPQDIDVVTHEAMHLVQAYPPQESNKPSWLVEGIADYVRATMGVNNAQANWSMPPYDGTQSYTNSYRITARFLVWLDTKVKPGIVKQLDAALRAGTYRDSTWTDLTGKSVDALWAEYGANPGL